MLSIHNFAIYVPSLPSGRFDALTMLVGLITVVAFSAACRAQNASNSYDSLLDEVENLYYEYSDSFQHVGSIRALSGELSSVQSRELELILSKQPRPKHELVADLEKFVRSLPQELQEKQRANFKKGTRREGMRPRTKLRGWLSEAALRIIKEVATLCLRDEQEKAKEAARKIDANDRESIKKYIIPVPCVPFDSWWR